MAATDIRIEGLGKLIAKIKLLPGKVARKVSGQSVRAAMAPMRKAIRGDAPVGETGNLKQSIFTKVKRYQQGEYFLAVVGPRYGRKRGSTIPIGPHGHLQEFGTIHQPPRPFVRPIWDRMHGQAEFELAKQLGKRIAKEAAKQ